MLMKLIDTSISASWLILAVIVLRRLCKRIPRGMICLLWGLVAIRLICPVSIQSPLSLVPDTRPIVESVVAAAAPAPPQTTDSERAENGTAPIVPAWETDHAAASAPDVRLYATVVWMIGMLALLGYAAASYFRLRRRVSASIRVRENIWLCDWVESPFILGIVRPRIYLPSSMEYGQFPYILAHENAHLKRRDHGWKPLGFVLLAVYWFNPLVWVAYILLCRDIELACDECVVHRMGAWGKKLYSAVLLSCSTTVASVCPVAFGGVGVKERVRSVLHYRKPALRSVIATGIIGLVMAVCFLTDPARGLAGADGDIAPAPTPLVQYVTVENAAARPDDPPGEADFIAMLREEWTGSGYEALSYAQYAAQYTCALLPLTAAPEGYQNLGYVFVRPDPGMPDHTMFTQVLYNYSEQAAIIVQQDDRGGAGRSDFFYSDRDERGEPLGDHCWFSYQAGYGDTAAYMLLRSTRDLGAENCRLILQSLWPEG